MTDHAQRARELYFRLCRRDQYPSDPSDERDARIECLAEALAEAHAAGRRAGLEELEGQIDQLGDSYFHLGNTQARLAIEAVEKLIAKAKEGT